MRVQRSESGPLVGQVAAIARFRVRLSPSLTLSKLSDLCSVPATTALSLHHWMESKEERKKKKEKKIKVSNSLKMTMKERDDNDNDNDEEEEEGEEENQENEEDDDDEDDEEGDGEGGDGSFFESFDRVPSGISFDMDLPSSDSDDDDDDDVRISFASAMAPPSFRRLSDFDDVDFDQHNDNNNNNNREEEQSKGFDYGVWMAEPMSVMERRRKLLQGMGLASTRNTASMKQKPPQSIAGGAKSGRLPPNIPLAPTKSRLPHKSAPSAAATATHNAPLSPTITRSRSDTHLALPDPTPIAALFRVSSAPPSQWRRWARPGAGGELGPGGGSNEGIAAVAATGGPGCGGGEVLKIKDLDTGKEIVVSSDGAVAREFVGSSPIVKEVMRRDDSTTVAAITAIVPSATAAATGQRTFSSKGGGKPRKKKVNWLKNFKFVASTMTGLMSEKEKEREREKEAKDKSERLKVHQHGKSYKELTGLYMCQEIQAHMGSIWTMKFSCDSRYLASAGEDRVVHVWQVVECDTITSSLHRQDQPDSPGKQPPLSNGRSSTLSKSNRSGGQPSKRKKGKGSGSVPDFIVMPETIFSLSTDPFCSLEGHTDDVLDLSWSNSQYLLSSSMDKSVRLWDIETKTCLKLFAHRDYVTCIQFNPIDERYFISGSLDSKVRIWSIPDRLVVDWNDLHEMVTATCYTPDGQGALVGSHKGNCRFYNTSDAKLTQEGQIEVRTKKKKNNAKKITGFQFAPDNSSEVLITSADSQIRVFDGERMTHKFRGFRNTSSQISASCTMDGKHVVCASEDSHVYIWKRDRPRSSSGKKVTTRSHEHFYCKDVLVAVPWPNGGTNCEPSPDLPSWSRTNNLRSPSNLEDTFSSSRSHNEQTSTSPDDIHNSPRSGSTIGSSARMGSSASLRSGHATGSSSSSFSSWGWVGNSNRITSSMEAANSWGLVVVTASLGGNIRVYQNFGLPLRLRGPAF